MTATAAKANTEVLFDKKNNGYDREQVDRYVANLSKAYQQAYDEYVSVCDKYNDLLEKYKNLKETDSGRPSADIIEKTLVNTEILVKKLIEDAGAEAEKIKADARAGVKKIIEDAGAEAGKIKADAREEVKRITEDAYIRAAAAKLKAEKINSEANAEAVRTKRVSEQTNAAIRLTIKAMQSLLTPASEMPAAAKT